MPLHTTWSPLGNGSYNKVFKSADGKYVLKLRKDAVSEDELASPTDKVMELDTPIRSVILWNIFNDDLDPKATLYELSKEEQQIFGTNTKMCWVCPFVEGDEVQDDELAQAIIGAYTKTGRIVLDGMSPRNFVKEKGTGKIRCVDVGMALQLEKEGARQAEPNPRSLRRVPSLTSLACYSSSRANYLAYLNDPFFIKFNPIARNVIKALLVIKELRPDIIDTNFLLTDSKLCTELADGYDQRVWEGPDETLTSNLEKASPKTAEADTTHEPPQESAELSKASLLEKLLLALELVAPQHGDLSDTQLVHITKLNQYIRSRIIFDDSHILTSSLINELAKENKLSAENIDLANDLIGKLQRATSFQEIQEIIEGLQKEDPSLRNPTKSDLAKVLIECLRINQDALNHEPKGKSPPTSFQ